MRRYQTKQDGLTATGYMVLIILLTFAAAIALKLIPVYIQHYYVVHSLEGLQSEAATIRDEDIRPRLLKNFSINDVEHVDRNDIKLKRLDSRTLEVSVIYDVQKRLLGNVDVVIHFSDSVILQN
jgi:hypothetical protein